MTKSAIATEWTNPAGCNCLALRQAARHVSQFYDQFLTASGLRTTQYSILARLQRKGPMSINALAAELVMDRTTLGRNILPLERDGLIAIRPGRIDRRSKDVQLTKAGAARFRARAKAGARRKRGLKGHLAVHGPRRCARCCTKWRPMRRSPPRRNSAIFSARGRFASFVLYYVCCVAA
jgi:DNA-binding MarR family transcriptional regulator